jgi:cyclophilin family peptidyl-prolyl cis-trans isomerase/HEAT repeat protein
VSRSIVLATLLLLVACSAPSGPDPLALAEDLREAESAVLIETLADAAAPTEQRVRAARAMGRIQSPGYAAPLAAAAGATEVPELRHAALFAIGQLGLATGATAESAAVDAVVAALEDADTAIAAAATEALGKLAPDAAAERLVPLLADERPGVRTEAALALFRLRFVPPWRGQADEPPPLPQQAVDALVRAFDDPDPDARRAAVYAFSRFGQPGVADAIASRVDDPDEWTRLFAVRTLGRSAPPARVPALGGALADPSPRVRTEAIDSIARLVATHDWPEALLDDDSFHVRAALARALATSTDDAGLRILRAFETDASPTVRAAAIGSLARRLQADYLEAIEGYLGADHPAPIRVAAAAAAAHAGEAGLPPLLAAAADADPGVAVTALGALPDEASAEPVTRAMTSDDLAIRGAAIARWASLGRDDTLAGLERAYDDSAGPDWIEIREALVDAVADLDGAEPLLRRMLETDAAVSVRVRARQALVDRGVEAPEVAPPPIEPSPHLETRFESDPVVVLETSKGEIEIRCLAREAPNHVANFVQHVREGFYDGLGWHRVVPNFVIQGGDPRGDGWGSAGPILRDEINPVRYGRGAVGMPKAGKDTGSCQIFITHIPTPHLDGNYTVFGVVTAGLDVVDRIEVGDSIVRARLK